jgi:hypothetical protein
MAILNPLPEVHSNCLIRFRASSVMAEYGTDKVTKFFITSPHASSHLMQLEAKVGWYYCFVQFLDENIQSAFDNGCCY